MIKILRIVYVLLIVLGVAPVTSAKKPAFNLSEREATGFNALDHVLQKPLGNDTFPSDDRGFGRHMFIGAGGGISVMANSFSSDINPGWRLGGQFGGWFTPTHGLRFSGEIGRLSVHDGASKAMFGALRAEYLLNLTTLLRGYNPYRRFEMIGAVGLEARRIQQQSFWINNGGIVTSLQMRFNVASSLFLFVEPRLAVMAGPPYDRPGNNLFRVRSDVSFNAGLGYRLLTGRLRKTESTPFIQMDDDNIFFGGGVGLWSRLRNIGDNNAYAHTFVGKMFSSVSGIQLNAGFGQQHNSAKNKRDRYMAIGALDYVLNLNNLMGGYRPNQSFQILINAGAGIGMVMRTGANSRGHEFSPALSVGFTGLFRLTENWGLYIHPQLYNFNSKFTSAMDYRRTPYAMVDLGLRYTIGRFSQLFPESIEKYSGTNHWFISSGFGGAMRVRSHKKGGFQGYFGIGKRFTPVSSWRLTLEGNAFTKYPRAIGLTLNADYLSSLTTAMCGYDPDRIFDLQAVIGAFGGISNVNADLRHHIAMGLKGGLQFGFRLNNSVDLYLEPQFLMAYIPVTLTTSNEWTPVLRANVGVRYKLGAATESQHGTLAETPYGQKRNFMSIAGGPMMFSQSTADGRYGAHTTGVIDLAVGRWTSMVSGFRAVLGNNIIYINSKNPETDGNKYVGSVHFDYLLNISTLINRNAERKLHVIGAFGAGAAFGFEEDTSTGFMGYGGVQLRYNLPYDIDVHIEPGAEFWPNNVMPDGFRSPSKFVLSPRLALGVSYRF